MLVLNNIQFLDLLLKLYYSLSLLIFKGPWIARKLFLFCSYLEGGIGDIAFHSFPLAAKMKTMNIFKKLNFELAMNCTYANQYCNIIFDNEF